MSIKREFFLVKHTHYGQSFPKCDNAIHSHNHKLQTFLQLCEHLWQSKRITVSVFYLFVLSRQKQEWKGLLQLSEYTLYKHVLCNFSFLSGLDVHLLQRNIYWCIATHVHACVHTHTRQTSLHIVSNIFFYFSEYSSTWKMFPIIILRTIFYVLFFVQEATHEKT